MKTCTKCGVRKLLKCFYTQASGDGYRAACKSCHGIASAQRCKKAGDTGRAKRAKAEREKRSRDPEYRLAQTLNKFRMTPDQFRQMEKKQNGLCAICGQPETDKRNHRLAVDHDHATGKVRGLLCKSCNIGLGMFKDSTAVLSKAIFYLDWNKD